MKKKLVITGILILTVTMLTGCGSMNSSGNDLGKDLAVSNDILDVADYTIPEDYVLAEEQSTPDKVFYVHKDDKEEIPDNISIEVGTNSYALTEHEEFRDAIMFQLEMQADESGAEVEVSDPITTKNGELLYSFVMDGSDGVTSQHYLVGDKRYCLIHETNWTGNPKLDEATESIVQSFKWKEEE